MNSFVFHDNEFINLYTEENPMLIAGEDCYFLLFNVKDYHFPVICRGKIIQDTFSDGFNKHYYIKLIEFVDPPKIVNTYMFRQSIIAYPYIGDKLQSKRVCLMSPKFNFDKYLFKAESFFVRKTLDDILTLRREFVNYVMKDLEKMLQALREL